MNRKVILAMLIHLGYSADTALNGFEVLVALKNEWYDLILMNVGLPEMDGMEVTRRIRRIFQNGPRIIACHSLCSSRYETGMSRSRHG